MDLGKYAPSVVAFFVGILAGTLKDRLKELSSKRLMPALERGTYSIFSRLGGDRFLLDRYKKDQTSDDEVTKMRVGFKNVRIDVRRQYVKLKLTPDFIPPSQRPSQDSEQRTQSLQEIIGGGIEPARLIVLGHPGSGKTTLLKYLMLTTLQERPIFSTTSTLPMLLFLRRFRDSGTLNLENFLLESLGARHLPRQLVLSKLESGKCLILLDGLDELVGDDQARVADQIREFSHRYNKNRFIVTSRIAGYAQNEGFFKEAEIAPLDVFSGDVRDFISGILESRGLEKSFFETLRTNKHLRRLTESPLLLGLILFIYKDDEGGRGRGHFPQKRTEVYKTFVRGMMRDRDEERQIYRYRNKFDPDTKDRFLRKVAHSFFLNGVAEFARSQLLDKVNEPSSQISLDRQVATEFLEEIVKYNGLLQNTYSEQYSFVHPTFQEYYVAREIKELSTVKEEVYARIGDPAWHEVIFFLCGLLDIEVVKGLIEYVIEQGSDYVLAGRCLAHASTSISDLSSRIVPRLLRHQTKEAKQALVEIGDSSVVESLLPILEDPEAVPDDQRFARECLYEIDTQVVSKYVLSKAAEAVEKDRLGDAIRTLQKSREYVSQDVDKELDRLTKLLSKKRETTWDQAVGLISSGEFSEAEIRLEYYQETEEPLDEFRTILNEFPKLRPLWAQWRGAVEADKDLGDDIILSLWFPLQASLQSCKLPYRPVLESAVRYCDEQIPGRLQEKPRLRWVRRKKFLLELVLTARSGM